VSEAELIPWLNIPPKLLPISLSPNISLTLS
jgi:hypothetical protein